MVHSGLPESLCLATDGEHHRFCPTRLNLQVPTFGGRPLIETADVSLENLAWLRAAYPQARIVATTSAHLLSRAEVLFGTKLADDAVHSLARMHPSLSARTVLTPAQGLVLSTITIMTVASFALWPLAALRTLLDLTTIGFVTGALFRALLAWIGGVPRDDAPSLADDDDTLPVYTILVPLYREANVVPELVRSLIQLDYPREKLDIKLILESDDDTTVAAAVACADHAKFHIVRVPPGEPRTKPRACNYAFAFARGEFTVIFDAEDRPEPDQLRKAVAQFRASPREIACLQARLNFYNANENWLTRGIMAQTPLAE